MLPTHTRPNTVPNVRRSADNKSQTNQNQHTNDQSSLLHGVLGRPNDPSSATRPTRWLDCSRDARAGFASAHGAAWSFDNLVTRHQSDGSFALAVAHPRSPDEPLHRCIKLLLTRRVDKGTSCLMNDDVTVRAWIRPPRPQFQPNTANRIRVEHADGDAKLSSQLLGCCSLLRRRAFGNANDREWPCIL